MASEKEIRELVARVVDGLGVAPVGAAPADTVATDKPSPGAQATPGADVAVGADHGGFALKERIGFKLKQAGFTVHDCGTHTAESVDYPDYAHAVARLVADGVELKCRRCKRTLLVPLSAEAAPGTRSAPTLPLPVHPLSKAG